MLSWFNNKKKNKLFDADIQSLEEIHSKIVVLNDKRDEILKAEGLTDDERNQLTGMLDSQMEIIRKDALIFGATLAHYFDGNEVARVVPKGVDLREHDFCTTPKPTEKMADLQISLKTSGENVTNMSDRVVDRMIDRDVNDEISDSKLKVIRKLPFKRKLKDGLNKIHNDKKAERKDKLTKYVKGVKPPLPALQREANIIKQIVLNTIDSRQQHEMIQSMSSMIASVEASLTVDEVYKTFLNLNNIMQLSFPNAVDGELRTQLKEEWIQALRETGDFVLVKQDVTFNGKRTGSTGPR